MHGRPLFSLCNSSSQVSPLSQDTSSDELCLLPVLQASGPLPHRGLPSPVPSPFKLPPISPRFLRPELVQQQPVRQPLRPPALFRPRPLPQVPSSQFKQRALRVYHGLHRRAGLPHCDLTLPGPSSQQLARTLDAVPRRIRRLPISSHPQHLRHLRTYLPPSIISS